MSTGAKLTSVESLAALKSAVAAFVDDAKTALGAVEMETRRVQDWLGREMPAYWQRQLQKWREEIAVAKAALARKRLQRTEHYIPDTSEEEKMLAYAKFKCEEAEEKLEKIKKWSRQIERNWDEYQGIAGQLADIVVGNPPKCVADLNR
ncbi:MAG TPA: hypothetical protein VNC50_11305, partial [Planctomycetia bacterium]|nr:hypothetical protein [Planctomycetia bacterium]